ncbi:peptide deformylase [Peribacillus sp. SCS-155]|uniref:peptide deformylase n=1 Tax=Peribacillus sedimenti TaxID=3115297 RepID=UPI0039060680
MSKFQRDYIITMKDVIKEGDPILRKVIDEIPMPPGEEEKEELTCMMNFLKNSQDPVMSKRYNLRAGVGLSANQIGLNKKMFAAYFTDEKGELHELALINPKIVSTSTTMIYLPQSEGCLSVDRDVVGYVPRYERVKIQAHDKGGNVVSLRFKGFASIVMQHEIDHLNGVMFYDRINQDNPFQLPADVEIRSIL